MNIKELKLKAKESLVGHYLDAIGIMLLASVATSVGNCLIDDNNAITIILALIINLGITGAFGFGQLSFYLKMSRNEDTEVNELWSKTNMWNIYILSRFVITVFTSLWSLLLIIPGIIASFSYSMTHYILLDNPNMNIMDALKESKKIMRGHKMDLFVLNLSFIGWIILGIFTLGILYFWLTPYIYVTQCNFYNSIKEK